MDKKNVFIAADHAGFALKEALVPYLQTLGYTVEDCGAQTLTPTDDYPDFVLPCAKRVAETVGSFGIVIGGSGEGEAMAANRVPGIRAAVYYGEAPHPQTDAKGNSLSIVESERTHNDANILSLGARFISPEEGKEAVRVFLATPFSHDERHERRLEKF